MHRQESQGERACSQIVDGLMHPMDGLAVQPHLAVIRLQNLQSREPLRSPLADDAMVISAPCVSCPSFAAASRLLESRRRRH
ncbi:hypothetical protein RU08_09865 [Pseudomonas fulva]|uniref:Uncharacterized protein n=1 Tax=Pseudomonas fulva TaxID=47880 RepID=A0A0D0KVA7_9PSED|nr:hypothetical protein RU08_09865 [Pseudomonas fulva]